MMTATWKPTTAHMSEEVYRKEMLRYVDELKQHPAKGYLSDMRQFLFTITPDLQMWVGSLFNSQNFGPSENQQQIKSAVVVSHDFFSHVSVEQTIDEIQGNDNNASPTRYFDSMEDALEWMTKD